MISQEQDSDDNRRYAGYQKKNSPFCRTAQKLFLPFGQYSLNVHRNAPPFPFA